MANLIAMPEGHQAPDGLTEAIRTAKGRTLLPETVMGGWGDKEGAPRKDFVPSPTGRPIRRRRLCIFGSMSNRLCCRVSVSAPRSVRPG